jgi:hypothetical protein
LRFMFWKPYKPCLPIGGLNKGRLLTTFTHTCKKNLSWEFLLKKDQSVQECL